jgi:hypothetical protein
MRSRTARQSSLEKASIPGIFFRAWLLAGIQAELLIKTLIGMQAQWQGERRIPFNDVFQA